MGRGKRYTDEVLEELARRAAREEIELSPYQRTLRHRRAGRPWLSEEEEFIRRFPRSAPYRQAAAHLLRGPEEVAAKFLELQGWIPPKTPITQAEIEYVCRRAREEGIPFEEVARAIGRTAYSAWALGLSTPCSRRSRRRKAKKGSGAGQ